jgi:hypothetical protein
MYDSIDKVIEPLIVSLRLFKEGIFDFNIVETSFDLKIPVGVNIQSLGTRKFSMEKLCIRKCGDSNF